MSHENFRYLIPGIVFYIPLYFAAWVYWLVDKEGHSFPINTLVGRETLTLLTVLVLPTGWFVYQSWRVWWQLFRGGYERRDFLDHIRQAVRVYNQEDRSRTVVDFSPILGSEVGVRWFNENEYACVFDPFGEFKSLLGFQSTTGREKRSKGCRYYLHFVEPVSDLILFRDASYDYARSISTTRYGMWVSFFALIYGTVVLAAVSPSWWFPKAYSTPATIVLLFYVACSVASFAVVRMRMAKKEHEARVQLITQINSAERVVDDREIESMLGSPLLAELRRVSTYCNSHDGKAKLVFFDMDGTLINHDMGDAVLAMLIKQGRIERDQWDIYQKHLSGSRPRAYEFAVTVMRRLSVRQVQHAAREVFQPEHAKGITLSDGIIVPRPTVIPKMQALVMWLQRHDYQIYIVTATNQWAAEIVAADYFGITGDHVIGVQSEVKSGRLTDKLIQPVPISEGKLAAWKARLGERPPVLGAGDSGGDAPLLRFVDTSGSLLWLGPWEKRPEGLSFFDLGSM